MANVERRTQKSKRERGYVKVDKRDLGMKKKSSRPKFDDTYEAKRSKKYGFKYDDYDYED